MIRIILILLPLLGFSQGDFFKYATFYTSMSMNTSMVENQDYIAINKGYKIPEDISIIAFTDGVLSKHAIPSLSTISQHAVEMGEKSATMLIHKLEELTDEEEYQTQVINTTLIERDTTR